MKVGTMCCVMVVEDNPDLRSLYKQTIEFEGHETLTASNGKEALVLLRTMPRLDVIFLDLMMPIMDGWEFLREKSQDVSLASVPVVVCSAAQDRLPEGLKRIRKPVDIDIFVKVVDQYCS